MYSVEIKISFKNRRDRFISIKEKIIRILLDLCIFLHNFTSVFYYMYIYIYMLINPID